MTFHKATTIMGALTTIHNIDSWCQKVLDLLDLMFAELFVILWNYKEHLELRFPVDYQNYQGLSTHLDGNSDKSDIFFETKEEN